MSDRGDRSDRLRKRFEDDAGDGESADQSGSSPAEDGDSVADLGESFADAAEETSDSGADEREGEREDTTSEASDEGAGEAGTATDETPLKERSSVLMYLPEDTRSELDIRFDELNARYKREHGEPLEKNRDYYPAVIEAGLSDETVEEILDL